MPIDRGGLHYSIEVENRFSQGLEQFRAGVRAARAEFALLKKELESRRTSSRDFQQSTRELRSLIKARKADVRATQQQAAASDNLTKRFNARRNALAGLRKETQRQATSQARALLTAKQGFTVERRLATALESRRGAEKDLTKVINKRSTIEERSNVSKSRGIKLSEKERRSLGLISEAEKKAAIAAKLLSDAKERGAIASQRQAAAEDKVRVAALRSKILERATETDKLAKAKERVAAATEKQAAAEAKLRERQQRTAERERLKQTRQTRQAVEALHKQQKIANNENLRQTLAQTEALRRRNSVLKEQATRSVLASQGLDTRGVPLVTEQKTLKERFQGFLKLNRELHKSQVQGNRVSFTFRRLFGILAAFAAARIGISAFGAMVKQMALFNAKLEQAELGIATLFAAVGTVRDATGEAADASRQLALAQNEARRQLALLRRDALETVATFDQLVIAFQVAIAPGLNAGLDIDEIRKFSVQIAQAAAAIGLEQNQLAEEIRSVLEGNIRTRTTRIATALGITNEDIRQAKEAGVVFEFLQERFQSFSIAGEKVAKNFEALFVNLKDGFIQVLGAGGIEFFEELKTLLSDLRNQIISQDPITGILRPDPKAVSVIAAIGAGLAIATTEAGRLQQALGFEEVKNLASLIGGAIRIGAQVFTAAIEGVVLGFNDLKEIATVVVDTFEKITGIDLGFDAASIQSAVRIAVRFLTVVTSINLIVGSFSLLFTPFVVLWSTLSTILGGALFTLGLFKSLLDPIVLKSLLLIAPYIAIAVALGVGLEFLRQWSSELVGIDLKFSTLLKLFQQSATNIAANVEVDVSHGFRSIEQEAKLFAGNLKNIFDNIKFAFLEKATLFQFRASSPEELANIRKTFATVREMRNKEHEERTKQTQETIDLIHEQDKAAKAALKSMNDQTLGDILEDNDNALTIPETIGDIAKKVVESISESLKSGFSGIKDELQNVLDPSIEDATKLSETFEKLPGIIAASSRGLEDQERIIKEIREAAEEANDALRFGETTLGLTGNVLEQRRTVFDAEVKQRKKSEQITLQERDTRLRLVEIDRRRLRIERQFATLNEGDQVVVNRGIESGKRLLAVKREISKAEVRVSLEQAKVNSASRDGLVEEERAAKRILKIEEDFLNTSLEILEIEKRAADEILSGRDQAEATLLSRLITDRLRIQGEEKVAQEQLKLLAKDRIVLEHEINRITTARLKLLSDQANFDLSQGIDKARGELAELTAQFNTRFGTQSERDLAVADTRLNSLRVEAQEALRIQKIEEDNLKLMIAQAKAQETLLKKRAENAKIEEAKNELLQDARRLSELITSQEQLLLTTKERNKIAQHEQNILLIQADEQAQSARNRVERPISTGIGDGLRLSLAEVEDAYFNTLNLVRGAVRNFADFTSSAIVDAFDPTTKVDLRERFGRFLQSIARQIISTLVQVAVTRAALGLTAFPIGLAQGGKVPPASGFATGGQIPHKNTWDSARGFAIGGRQSRDTRPRGLPPTDTVPIWTTPGEWIIRTSAVRKYGEAVMGRLNEGLIDPLSLKALAGGRRMARRAAQMPQTIMGFAAGGQVPSTSRELQASPSVNEDTNISIAIVAPSEDALGRLLAGGKNAMLEFIEQHADTIRPLLNG